MSSFDAWKSRNHVKLFDEWSRVPSSVLQDRFERCNEVKLLNQSLKSPGTAISFLEVGCATGEFSRYLKGHYPKIDYTGCDISEVAILRAQEKFPGQGRFVHTDETLKDVADLKPEVLFCRDVILHQPEPFAFLKQLYYQTTGLLILRLRTRDVGATEGDPTQSCQLNYGMWAPYMVLNCTELFTHIKSFDPPPARIHLMKHYMVLGGQYARFLPKDCYLPETGTAESALLVEKGTGASPCEIREEEASEDIGLSLKSKVLFKLFSR